MMDCDVHACVCAKLLQLSNSVTLWPIACQAPLSIGFSRQEYWSVCHTLLQGIFLTQGSNSGPLTLLSRFFTLVPPGRPCIGM